MKPPPNPQPLRSAEFPSDAGTTFKAFVIGALGTVLGTVIAFALVGRWMGPDGWKMAACLCASYVGGSINYAATAQALGVASGASLAAGEDCEEDRVRVISSSCEGFEKQSLRRRLPCGGLLRSLSVIAFEICGYATLVGCSGGVSGSGWAVQKFYLTIRRLIKHAASAGSELEAFLAANRLSGFSGKDKALGNLGTRL